jgi:hypothetical protein
LVPRTGWSLLFDINLINFKIKIYFWFIRL